MSTASREAPSATRFLIVNADDFGRSEPINAGVAKAHEQGIVTSASLMVRYPATAEAALYAGRNLALSIGLHVDLSEWAYEDGDWRAVYEVVPFDDEGAVAAEVSRQLEAFRRLLDRDPTHLDSHQHVHTAEPTVHAVLSRIAKRLGVPLRGVTPEIRHWGHFYGQTDSGTPIDGSVSVENLIEILGALPSGVTELGCHPAEGVEVDSVYAAERQLELETLCDPRVRAAIEERRIALRSFAAFPAPAPAAKDRP